MPALIIETQEDGSVLVAPATTPIDPATAETFASLEEAASAVKEVLGQGAAPAGEQGAQPPGAPGPVTATDPEADMQTGYDNAKKGR
jgi:hypothetical protein